MKQVGLAACIFQRNYGSVLQAYATKTYIEFLGKKCEVMDYRCLKDVKKRRRQFFLKEAFNLNYSKIKIPMFIHKCYINNIYNSYTKEVTKRFNSMELFVQKHFDISPAFENLEKLKDYAEEHYEAVVVGSDQLWLPANVFAGFYTLGFIEKSIRKISYATSFGQSYIPNRMKKAYQEYLRNFDYISVRECNGADLIYEITEKKVAVVCDPVFLLSEEKWSEVAGSNAIVKGNYALCYFLGSHRRDYLHIRRYCITKGYKMVVVSNIERYSPEEKYGDDIIVSASPEEFLNLIKNARLVCTDSFHCSAFSIIFKKEFIPFMRFATNNKYSTNGRIIELLDDFKYKYYANDRDLKKRICYPTSNNDKVINSKVEKADAYFRKAFGT